MTNSNSGNKQVIPETINQFIKLLGKPQDAAWVRYLDPLRKKPSGDDHHWSGSPQDVAELQNRQSEGFNAYLIIGNGTTSTGKSGNQNDADITDIPALFVEWDDKPIDWQISAWKELSLPEPSIQVHTGGKSIHCYWVLDTPMAPAEWRVLIKRLILHTGADQANKNPSRAMRLPGAIYINKQGEQTGVAEIIYSSDRRYSASEIEECLPPVLPAPTPKAAARPRFTAPTKKWEPRTEADLIDALKQVPVFEHDQGRREELIGLAFRLTAEIGAERGLQLMQEHSPAVNDMASYFNIQPTQINAGSIWPFLREHYGVDISRTSRKKDNLPKKFSALMSELLKMTIAGREDETMELRAEIKGRFHLNDSYIESQLFKLHTKGETQSKVIIPPESLDLSQISGLDWLIEGFVPDNDITLIWGAAGDGKTTAALAASKALLLGTGLLDHPKPAEKGAVLFIASDSGAPPLLAAMQEIGMTELAEVKEGANKHFYLWASDQIQGMTAWAADLIGCVKLLKFVKQKQIKLVVIDSCKAVCSGADLDYTNNQLVTSLLTYFKEVICPHAAVIFLNHDGTQRGACAGAKAWKEIPSVVHCISREKAPDGTDIDSRRQWTVTKSRLGPGRRFYYQLDKGLFELCPNQEVHGNCLDQVIEELSNAWICNGKGYMTKKELISAICKRGGPAEKTLNNTLTEATKGRSPKICRSGFGRYKLAPKLLDLLKTVHTNQEEFPEKEVISMDLVCSREIPSGTSSSPPTRSNCEAEKFPGKNEGNILNPACSSQSEEILPDENVMPKKLLPLFELRSEAELIKIREDAEKYWEDLQREQDPRRKQIPSPVLGSNC